MNNVERITHALIARNIPVVSTSDWEHDIDGDIQINDTVHVQVGHDYVFVNQWVDNGNALRHGTERRPSQIELIAADVLALLK